MELHSPKLPVTVLWWRSVGHTHTAFVMESLIDELAHAAKADPLEYRRRLLAKHPRHLGVLNLAAEKAGWGTPLPAGRVRGLAVHESFGSFVATVAEVSVAGDGDSRAPPRVRGGLRHLRESGRRARRRWRAARSTGCRRRFTASSR